MSAHQAPISHRHEPAILLMRPWRTGHSTGRAIYCWPGGDDDVIGLMDTRPLAWAVATTHNRALTGQEDYALACQALGLDAAGAP